VTDVNSRDLTAKAFSDLHATFAGDLLRPEDPGYDDARRVWNGMHDRHPVLIARCRNAQDVSLVLRQAADVGVPVTVRGGGHNVAGAAVADGAVMVDLCLMRHVRVDPLSRLAHAAGGSLLRDVDGATTPHGLACPAGVVSHTGLGGLALGGGYGWLARKWGLTCDHIESAEVVLADGTIVTTDADHYPELFWALRGGGVTLGVVTQFTLRLRPVTSVHHHVGVFALDQAVDALDAYRVFAEDQSRNLHTTGCLKHAGRQDWIPSPLRGRPALFLTAAWFGEPEQGPDATEPLFAATSPAGTHVNLLSYAGLQALGDTSEPHGNRYFTKSCYLRELNRDTHTRFVAAAAEMTSTRSSIDFEYLGGAIAESPETASAFPHRDAAYMYTASAQWTDAGADDTHLAWSRRSVDALRHWHYGEAYVNYQQDARDLGTAALRPDARHRRLAALKARYDPDNLLRGTQHIDPAASVDTRKN
jgi:FAD/FMN-containing dehydrogenase